MEPYKGRFMEPNTERFMEPNNEFQECNTVSIDQPRLHINIYLRLMQVSSEEMRLIRP